MRRAWSRGIALAAVLGAAVVAYAVGNGDVRATPEVTIITITSTTGTGSGTATLQNTTGATSYNVLVGSDPGCDPQLSFSVSGGNPVVISPGTMRSVQLSCPARGSAAMRRCLYHARNSANGTALADFMSVCLYGSTATLMPQQTALDFGTVAVGENAMLPLGLRNDGTQPITRVYLQTTDLDGNFQLSTPCNPDTAFCDANVMAVPSGGTLPLQIKCTPQTAGMHTAQLYVGTNTFQLLAQPVTLTCMGTASTVPVLGVSPTNIDLQTPIEVTNGSASTVVHLANAGTGTLVINDVRIVDVDSGASTDWIYSATGECSGVITSSCSIDAGELVDINLSFDPSAIGRRRATLLISYSDSIARTKEIPLGASGLGATLESDGTTTLLFGMVPVGRPSTVIFDLFNRGNRDITAQLSLPPATTPPFSMMPSTSTIVAPNVPKTVSVTCTPIAAGPATTVITAEADDAFGSPPININASCQGTTFALHASPSALNLGEMRIGAGPVLRTIQLLSTSSPVTLAGQPQQESVNNAITVDTLSQMTTPASFDIMVEPETEGEIATTIAVSDVDGNTLRIPVTGKIVSADYEVAPTLDLGTFCVNQATSSSNASLASVGTATIALAQPTLDGSPSPFQVSTTAPPLYPSTLAPGKTATVSVMPHRQSAAVELSDMLTWHTDVEGAPTAMTALTAKFIDQGGAIAPPALDFGKVLVHLYVEDGQRVVIQNCNPTPLILDPPMIKTPFEIDSPNFPPMLNPNETVTFSVGFHPTRVGRIVDTLRITSPQLPGAPLEVMLVGEGVTPQTPPPDAGTGSNGNKDTSFYACSCTSSRPGGALPIVLAVMCVLFPRRAARRRRAANQLR
jgi:hypothetical protein